MTAADSPSRNARRLAVARFFGADVPVDWMRWVDGGELPLGPLPDVCRVVYAYALDHGDGNAYLDAVMTPPAWPPEYRTTSAEHGVRSVWDDAAQMELYRMITPNPTVPEGDGWALVATCASASRLFWTWRREGRVSR